MLFDLRGRGRRRTIQGIYLALAILMGGGLVGFGIGGSQGGILDAITGGGGGGGNDAFKDLVKSAEKRVQTQPRNPAAWSVLARVRFQEAGTGDNYNRNTGQFTSKGKQKLSAAAQAWDRYLALDPPTPDASTAALMVRAFSPAGLNQPQRAAAAQEIVAERAPSWTNYFLLAQFAYQAGQPRKGDLAARKAVSLAPKNERSALRKQLDAAKKGVGGATGATGATPTG